MSIVFASAPYQFRNDHGNVMHFRCHGCGQIFVTVWPGQAVQLQQTATGFICGVCAGLEVLDEPVVVTVEESDRPAVVRHES